MSGATCPCSCPLCAEALSPSAELCGGCGAPVAVFVIGASAEKSRQATVAAAIAGEADAHCRFLPELKAEEVCEGCGALLSSQAAVEWAGKSWCLPCVHRLRRDEIGDGQGWVAERRIYDNLALMLVTLLLPLSLLTAPMALYFLIRYRRAPRGLLPRSSLRWWLALGLALLSLLVWLGLLVMGISIMVRSLAA